jgi:hypothetical protein
MTTPNTQAEIKPLTEEEVVALRELLKSEDRLKWFWTASRTWALWLSAIAAMLTHGWDALMKIVSQIGG